MLFRSILTMPKGFALSTRAIIIITGLTRGFQERFQVRIFSECPLAKAGFIQKEHLGGKIVSFEPELMVAA